MAKQRDGLMKRSEINAILEETTGFIAGSNFYLPPFAGWTPEHWKTAGKEADEIRDNGLGWDVTDFGSGDFYRTGLTLFTLRNGSYADPGKYPKRYAEKIMMVREGQVTPLHFHFSKREDIINRGGGRLEFILYAADRKENLSDDPFPVTLDGVARTCRAGEVLVLRPGESICLEPYVYHTFRALPGYGPVLTGEVSDVNDDTKDNRFHEQAGRFPNVEEDEPPLFLLCNEYPAG